MPNDDFNFATYQRFLADRKLMGCRCQKCGRSSLPPRPICPECRSHNMEWTELDGEGAVVGFGEIAVVPAPMAKLGYGRGRPYVSGFSAADAGGWISWEAASASRALPPSAIVPKARTKLVVAAMEAPRAVICRRRLSRSHGPRSW